MKLAPWLLATALCLPQLALAQTAPPAAGVAPAPPAAGVAPAPPATKPASDDYADTRKGFDGRLVLAGTLRTLSSTHVYAGGINAAAGGQIRHVAIHGEAGFEHGTTAFGLATNRFRIGPSVEGIVDRLRLGGGFDFVYSSFQRATRSDTVGALALDFGAFALVDVVRFDGGAFVAGARVDLELLLGVQLGGSVQLGVRF